MSRVLHTPLFTQELPEKGVTKGHVIFTSGASAPTDVDLVLFAASLSAAVLYEKLQAGGTTMVMQWRPSSLDVEVIARFEGDGADLQWEMQPGEQSALEAAQEKIRSKTFLLQNAKEPAQTSTLPPAATAPFSAASAQPMPQAPTPANEPQTKAQEEAEDYLVKQLQRIP